MNLYLISQNVNTDYDTYDSAVVAAPDVETARDMNPRGGKPVNWAKTREWRSGVWASKREDVKVVLIGEATDGTEQGVICASLNAG